MPSLSFQVRVGIPGSLTIEIDAVPSLIQSRPVSIVPQLSQPLIGVGSLGSASSPAGSAADKLISNAWGKGWATPVSQRLAALGGNTRLQLLSFECPSLDVTDMAWGAQGTVDGTSDPVQVTAPLFGTSVYGRTFQEGDYILWNDSSIVNGLYQYEIDRIDKVRGNNFTLVRTAGRGGRAQFESPIGAHSNIQFFQLVDKTFDVLWQGEHQVFKFLWDDMVVAAVSATTEGL